MASHWTWSQIHITTASRVLALLPLLTFRLHLKPFSLSFSALQSLLTFSPVLKPFPALEPQHIFLSQSSPLVFTGLLFLFFGSSLREPLERRDLLLIGITAHCLHSSQHVPLCVCILLSTYYYVLITHLVRSSFQFVFLLVAHKLYEVLD